ncbi:BTAD domain-containing putative transcriptional regulator [Micromonospora sp. NPDC126480]|uniref:BTAD domain-containing putative transcriptional regulator n=1 Tax=Micromonospora sp. NPDC126480 TaxID=3155312 RepID=UPI0033171159
MELGPPKQCAVLALLALRAGERVAVEELADALWGENPPTSAMGLVHTYIARLRRVLEPDMPRRRRTNVISSTRGGYRLNVSAEQLDLQVFRTLTQQAAAVLKDDREEPAFQLLGQAMRAWQDPFLSDLTALLPDHPAIGMLRQELVNAGLEYVRLGIEYGRARPVLPTAERLALAEPFNEAVQARCVQALARTGQRAAALARYAEVCDRLRAELDVEPGSHLAVAYREAIAVTAEVRPAAKGVPDRPPWRGPGPVVDDLVGREEDLAALLNLLERYRMVTLTGPVGVGKTALALALAEAARDGYAGGVAVVELSGARSRADVAAAVAAVGPVPETTPEGASEPLGQRQLLVVLDNAELVVDETAELVNNLLRGSPGINVVVTSREILGMAYEAVHPVRPLAVGDDSVIDADGLRELPAVQLFARRAAQVSPAFQLSRSNAALVAAICRQLDGLPLAIELAAACLRTDPLWTLSTRMRDPLQAIRPTRRGGPRHHGSLHAAAHRSLELLDTAEQRCFASLSAVASEFCLEAAREVTLALSGESGDVRLLLDRLVDKSLLEVRSGPRGRRYHMLRTSRALAREVSSRFGYSPHSVRVGPCSAGCHCLQSAQAVHDGLPAAAS